MLNPGLNSKTSADYKEDASFLIQPVDLSCGPPIAICSIPVILGRQHRWTSKARQQKCSRRQAVLAVGAGRLEIQCGGQNPVELRFPAANGGTGQAHGVVRLKYGQRAELRDGDCFSLLAGGCILKVVKTPPNEAANGRSPHKSDGHFWPSSLRAQQESAARSNGHQSGPRAERFRRAPVDTADGRLQGQPDGLRTEGTRGCPDSVTDSDSDRESDGCLPKSPATLRSEGSKRVLASAQKDRSGKAEEACCAKGGGAEGAAKETAAEAFPELDEERVRAGCVGGALDGCEGDRLAEGVRDRRRFAGSALGTRDVIPSTSEESEGLQQARCLRGGKHGRRLQPIEGEERPFGVSEQRENTEGVVDKGPLGKPSVSPSVGKSVDWREQLAHRDIKRTARSVGSPGYPAPPSPLGGRSSADSFDQSSSESLGDLLAADWRHPPAGKRKSVPGSGGSLCGLGDDAEGVLKGVSAKRRNREAVRKSDRRAKSLPGLDNRPVGANPISTGWQEASSKKHRNWALARSQSQSNSSGESERERTGPGGRESPAEFEPGNVRQSSSLEKESERRLKKVGGGQPVPGHCPLPLFRRSPLERKASLDSGSGSEEASDAPVVGRGGFTGTGEPGWDDRGDSSKADSPAEELDQRLFEPLDLENERPNARTSPQDGTPSATPCGKPRPKRPANAPPEPRLLSSLLVTSTGYRGPDKQRLKRMVRKLGAGYTDHLGSKHTHLICWEFSGGKYERALEWDIPVVNHRWVEDCVWRREVVPEEGYRHQAGEDVGSLLESQPSPSPSEPLPTPQPLSAGAGLQTKTHDVPPRGALSAGAKLARKGARALDGCSGDSAESDENGRSSSESEDGSEDGEEAAAKTLKPWAPPSLSSSSESEDTSQGSDNPAVGNPKPRTSGAASGREEAGRNLRGAASKPSKPSKPWSPPSPPPLQESHLDFEEWKKRNGRKGGALGSLLRGEENESGGRPVDRGYPGVESSDEDSILECLVEDRNPWKTAAGTRGGGKVDGKRVGRARDGKSRAGGLRVGGEKKREKRKRCRKSSLSEMMWSSSGSGDSQRHADVADHVGRATKRNGLERMADRTDLGAQGGAFAFGGRVYEEREAGNPEEGPETEAECLEDRFAGGEGRKRPLKRLRKLRPVNEATGNERLLSSARGKRPEEVRRKAGPADQSWEGFDPKDWVDWSGRRGLRGLEARNAAEPEPEVECDWTGRVGVDRRDEKRGFGDGPEIGASDIGASLGYGMDGVGLENRTRRAFGGVNEVLTDGQDLPSASAQLNGRMEIGLRGENRTPQTPARGHVSPSQRADEPPLGSIPSSEHPVHLPRTGHGREPSDRPTRPEPSDGPLFHRRLQPEPPDRAHQRPRLSGGFAPEPVIRQASLHSVWAKAGASLRDDLPVRKRRREGFAGLVGAAQTARQAAAGRGPTPIPFNVARGTIPAETRVHLPGVPAGSKTPPAAKTPEQKQSEIARLMALMTSPSPGKGGGEVACVICQTTRASEVQGVLPCGHGFCYACVMSWAAVNTTCPLCKTAYDIVTKRHVADSEGVSPEDEFVQIRTAVAAPAAESEGPACGICYGRGQPDILLLCDGCEGGAAHTMCLTPPLAAVPSGPWLCDQCQRRQLTRAAYARPGPGRGTGQRPGSVPGHADGVGTGRGRAAPPAGGIDASFARLLDGHRSEGQRAAASLSRILPTRGRN